MATDNESALVQENIEEYISDENKIVTCKWLSLMLSLNINAAKRALYTFVEHQRNKGGNDDINVTYFVAGLGKTKSGESEHKCVIVPESDLGAVKKSLTTVTSCHIYSVQKAKLKDYIALHMTDYDIIRNNLESCTSYSTIKCPWATVKTEKQRGKTTGKETVVAVKAEQNGAPATTTPAASGTASSTKPASKKTEPKGSIASMFATASSKKGGGDEKATPAASKQTKPPAKKGVLAFFGADSGSKKTAPQKAPSPVKQEQKPQGKDRLSTRSKKADTADDEPGRKRRRRIKTDLFDSSDEEETAMEEEERLEQEAVEDEGSPAVALTEDKEGVSDEEVENVSEREESPAPEKRENAKAETPKKSPVNGERGVKRKRTQKVVSKQYLDEDGFLVTKKEVEWQSEDDSEEDSVQVVDEVKTKPNAGATKGDHKNAASHKPEPKGKTAQKKTNVSPQKGKQTSLMSFFKKK